MFPFSVILNECNRPLGRRLTKEKITTLFQFRHVLRCKKDSFFRGPRCFKFRNSADRLRTFKTASAMTCSLTELSWISFHVSFIEAGCFPLPFCPAFWVATGPLPLPLESPCPVGLGGSGGRIMTCRGFGGFFPRNFNPFVFFGRSA